MLGLFKKLTGWRRQPNGKPTAKIIPRSDHPISRKHISANALKVLYRLHNHGYQAYLVGGGVRDLMLGLRPKDFDVVTDARPEQIKALFRNCRLVGRRFRLAHITFGREIVEVATFRALPTENLKTKESGIVVRDNVYGTIDEDALRRDFTVNALYYNIADFSVVDFVGGVSDLKKRQLSVIGDPMVRYREDPVRMLRAVRLATKLGLKIVPSSAAPIPKLAHLLAEVSAARLWDECNKLFLAGFAQPTWHKLIETTLAGALFPLTVQSLKGPNGKAFRDFIDRATISTDARIAEQKPVNPAFLFAVLLWQPVLELTQRWCDKGLHYADAFQKASSEVLRRQCEIVAIPKRFTSVIRDIWFLQNQLPKRSGKRAERLMSHPRFRAAYDFLLLRATPGSKEAELSEWWTKFQNADSAEQRRLIRQVSGPQKRRRRGRSRKPRQKRVKNL